MKKQTVTQGAAILIMTGFISQIVLGMFNQLIVVRFLGEEGMSLYMLIVPTLTLLITITSLGLPVAIPTLISRAHLRQKNILSVSLIMASTSSLVISVILILIARPLATSFLHDERVYLPLLAIGPLLFLTVFSDILEAYFQGKQNMTPSAIALFIQQMVRGFANIGFLIFMLPHGIVFGVVGILLASMVGELVSIITLLFIFLRDLRRNSPRTTFKPARLSTQHFKDVIDISIPTTGNQLIGSFSQFLEPIIVIHCLVKLGFSAQSSSKLYASISGFALPILMLPLFISFAMTQSIIPSISQAFSKRNFAVIHRHLNTAFRFTFSISGLYIVLVMLFSFEMMEVAFNTTTGAEYLPLLAPFFALLFIQAPLTATLQAIDEAKSVMRSSFISSIIKMGLMLVLIPIPNLNIKGFILAIIIHTIILTAWHYYLVNKKVGYQANYQSVLNGILTVAITYLVGYLITTLYSTLNPLLQLALISLTYLILISLCGLLPMKFVRKRKKIDTYKMGI